MTIYPWQKQTAPVAPEAADKEPNGATASENEKPNGEGAPVKFDPVAVRSHIEMLHKLAAGQDGILLLAVFGENPDSGRKTISTVQRFHIGDVDGMTSAALSYENHPHANVYAPLAVMRRDLPPNQKGSERDVVVQLGGVIDGDEDAGRKASSPVEPNYVLRTSSVPAKNEQSFIFFDRPLPPSEAKPLLEALHSASGGDSGTKDLSHVWRIAGTANWPNKKKVQERNRPREPQPVQVIQPWDGSLTRVDELRAVLSPHMNGGAKANGHAHSDDAPGDVGAIMARLGAGLRKLIMAPPIEGEDRSRTLASVIVSMIRVGLSDAEILTVIEAHPNGIGAKYVGRPELAKEIERLREKFGPDERRQASDIDSAPITLKDWLNREFAPLEPLLGELLTTTTRALLCAPTGLGKTNICIQIAMHMAARCGFLHWQCSRPARVLYIDGEMSGRLFKKRLADAAERLGEIPETFFALSCADIEDFAPLNTKAGQKAIERLIARIGGVDFIFFDSVMCLIDGDMKDEESWQQTLPWIRSLTRRDIGQLWIHHTGHDETHGYGTKTREWQLDVVILLERVERDDIDVSFAINFQKARERTPDNRADFRPVKIWLVDDKWHYEIAQSGKVPKITPLTRKFFDALEAATIGNEANKMFNYRAASFESWAGECIKRGLIDRDKNPDSARSKLSRHRLRLIAANWIACNETMAWILI